MKKITTTYFCDACKKECIPYIDCMVIDIAENGMRKKCGELCEECSKKILRVICEGDNDNGIPV